MSFDPNRDGHFIWDYMHLMAANATTPEKRIQYMNWLNSLKVSFPCEVCRLHLIDNLDALPVESYGNTNISLFYHSWKLHDTVNRQTKKSADKFLTYEQSYEKWFHTSAPAGPQNKSVQNQQPPQPQQQTQQYQSGQQYGQPQQQQSQMTRQQMIQQQVLQQQSQPVQASSDHASCPKCKPSSSVIVKNSYDQHRANERKTFMSKNSK